MNTFNFTKREIVDNHYVPHRDATTPKFCCELKTLKTLACLCPILRQDSFMTIQAEWIGYYRN